MSNAIETLSKIADKVLVGTCGCKVTEASENEVLGKNRGDCRKP